MTHTKGFAENGTSGEQRLVSKTTPFEGFTSSPALTRSTMPIYLLRPYTLPGSGWKCEGVDRFAVIDACDAETSGSAFTPHADPWATRVPKQTSFSDLLVELRASFGLSVSDLARILLVERPTIYSWLRGENEPRQVNRDRVSDIWSICEPWRNRGLHGQRNLLKRTMFEGKCLFDLMTEEHLRKAVVANAISSLVERTDPYRGGTKGRAISEAFGRAIPASNDGEFDTVTGKPFSEDLG